MIIDRVTFTGADDSVDPEKLLEISREFPFVEWGILVSQKYLLTGTNRFPSDSWRKRLLALDGDMNLSLHVCGRLVRETLLGLNSVLGLRDAKFQRMQFNTHGQPHELVIPKWMDLVRHLLLVRSKVIVQMDEVNEDLLFIASRRDIKLQPLFDCSHGAGVSPESWPSSIEGYYNGYAGGLGPDNVLREIEKIATVATGWIWIDMETKVRSADDSVFDLDKVREVCTQVQPLIGKRKVLEAEVQPL